MSVISPASERRIRRAIRKEVTRGTTPASPVYDVVPKLPGSFLQSTRNQEVSNVSRGDRQDGQIIGGTRANAGTVKTPIAYEAAILTLMESALSNTFGNKLTSGAITGTFAASGSTFTRAAGDFTTAAVTAKLKIGDKVAVTGTASQGDALNGAIDASVTTLTVDSTSKFPSSGAVVVGSEWISYTSKTSTTFTGCTRGAFGTTAATHADNVVVDPVKTITNITSTVLTFSEACTNESSISTTFTANRKQLFSGTSRQYYTDEQYFADLDTYEVYDGQEINTMQVTIPTSGEASIDFASVGLGVNFSQVASSTYTDVLGNTPCAGSVTGSTLLVDGTALTTCIETIQLSINNNRAAKFGVGSADACLVEEGSFDAEDQFTAYFADTTQRTKFQNGTRFSKEIRVRDQNAGHGFNFCFPRLVYRTNQKATSGQTVSEQFTAYAERDPTIGSKFYIELVIAA